MVTSEHIQEEVLQECHTSWSGSTGLDISKKSPSPRPQSLRRNIFECMTKDGLDEEIRTRLDKKSLKFIDDYRWIISSILFGRIIDKRKNSESYTNLNYDILRDIISKRHCRRFLTELMQWGIIETDGLWSRGNKSKGYRLTAHYRDRQYSKTSITKKRMIDKIESARNRHNEEISNMKGYRDCLYWIKELRIDTKSAWNHISGWDSRSDRYMMYRMFIDMIASGNIFYVVDSKAARFHTNLSNLPSELRQYLHIKGYHQHKIKQVDITNSQPLLFALTLSQSPKIDPQERDRMMNLVLDGKFYEEFNETKKDRDKFKREFFRDVLYGEGGYETPMTKAFARKFPSYDALIREMKSKDYKSLSIAMQKEEAKVIYQAVDAFARETRYQAPILTIHDSLVTIEPFAHIADQVLKRTFLDRYQVIPTTTIK